MFLTQHCSLEHFQIIVIAKLDHKIVVIKIFLVPVTRFGIQIKSRIIQIRAYNICNMRFEIIQNLVF